MGGLSARCSFASIRRPISHTAPISGNCGSIAPRRGRWLLVLDTVPGENGYRLCQRAGWIRIGVIRDYALSPDGRLCDTAVFWKTPGPVRGD